jgi:putative DNA primase/helicase
MSTFVPDPSRPTIVELAIELWGQPTERQHDNIRFGARGSKAVKPSTGEWFDHEANDGGGYKALWALARPGQPLPSIATNGQTAPWLNIDVAYDYHLANGTLAYQVVRTITGEPRFLQRRPNGPGKWTWNLKGIKRVPYHLPELTKASPGGIVFVAEGEKDVDRLRRHGLVATCNPGGAAEHKNKAKPYRGKWLAEFSEHLRGQHVRILPDHDPPGEAHALDIARKLLGIAASVRIIRLPGLPPKGDASDWLNAGHTVEELDSLADETQEWVPPKAEEERPDEQQHGWVLPTEDAVATAFADRNVGRLVYDHTEQCWFRWTGTQWQRDLRNRVFHEARELTRAVRNRLNNAPAPLAKVSFVSAVERACRADPRLAVSFEVWDLDPWLLGTPDGVVDLRTGKLLPPAPDRFISRHTSVVPAPPGTPAPVWDAFLDEATKGDKEFQGFLHRTGGYVLTGDVSEEVLLFFYGPGGNGKGTVLTVLTGILGNYAVSVPIEVFTAGSWVNLEYYRAQMAGARLVTASETEQQAVWSETQIKDLTGNDTMLSGRHPYGRPFSFRPQAKILIIGNYAPKLKSRSPAMERRLRVAPFTHIPKTPDPSLKERLRAEYPAILRRLIDGCLQWQRDRLGMPDIVKAATSTYFEQQDAFRRWLDERCILDSSLSLKTSMLLVNYNEWAKANGEDIVSSNAFAELIDRTPGLTRVRGGGGVRLTKGIGLRAPSRNARYEPADDPDYGEQHDDSGGT